MTRERAETVANLVIGAIAAGIAYRFARDAAFRRRTWTAVRRAALAIGPWLIVETKQAWADTRDVARDGETSAPGQTRARDMDMMGR